MAQSCVKTSSAVRCVPARRVVDWMRMCGRVEGRGQVRVAEWQRGVGKGRGRGTRVRHVTKSTGLKVVYASTMCTYRDEKQNTTSIMFLVLHPVRSCPLHLLRPSLRENSHL